MTDKKLLQGLIDKDESIVEFLYRKYWRLLVHISYGILNNLSRAEDIAQETFLIAINKAATIKDDTKIVSWLCSICRNLSQNLLKKEKRLVSAENIKALNMVSDKAKAPDQVAEDKMLLETVKSILPNENYDIFIMHLVLKMSFREIGEVLNKSTSCVIGIYHRSLKKVKAYFGGKHGNN